jgi:MFS family permease
MGVQDDGAKSHQPESEGPQAQADSEPFLSRNARRRYSLSTATLCICSLTNAYLTISVFPYAGYMVLDLLPGIATRENSGMYAGMIASSFMLGRFLTAYQWGRVADYYGRVCTLQIALLLSVIFSILFGTSKSLAAALIWRTALGMSNGIISTTKVLANEIAHGNDVLERKTMGLVIGMRSWALLISPAIGGFLAEPLTQYRSFAESEWIKDSWIYDLLLRYPFFLPNAVGALFCLIGFVAVSCVLEETLPEEARHDPMTALPEVWDYICSCLRKGWGRKNYSGKAVNGEGSPLLVAHVKDDPQLANTDTEPSLWSRPFTRQHMIVQWMFGFVTTYIDEAFPLFCMSTVGGLGLAESSIGKIMSGAGLIFAIFQYASFSWITHRYGLYPSLMIGVILGTVPTLLIPLSLLFVGSSPARWFLSILIGVTKVMQSLYFASMAVAVNKTVTSTQRAKMNSLILVGGSAARGLGPILAGGLVTFSFSSNVFPAQYGSILIWTVVPGLGFIVFRRIVRLRKVMQAMETSPDVETTLGLT